MCMFMLVLEGWGCRGCGGIGGGSGKVGEEIYVGSARVGGVARLGRRDLVVVARWDGMEW